MEFRFSSIAGGRCALTGDGSPGKALREAAGESRGRASNHKAAALPIELRRRGLLLLGMLEGGGIELTA